MTVTQLKSVEEDEQEHVCGREPVDRSRTGPQRRVGSSTVVAAVSGLSS